MGWGAPLIGALPQLALPQEQSLQFKTEKDTKSSAFRGADCLGCLGVMLARNQRSATMNPPGVAGYAGGIRGPSPGAEVEARWRARGRRQQGQVEDLRR